MHFSPWQIDRMRRQLNRYQYYGGPNNSALSLTKVYQRLIQSPAVDLTGKHGKALYQYEAFRRFLNEAKKQDSFVLENIFKFLVAERWLNHDAFLKEDEITMEMLEVTKHLALSDKQTKEMLAELPEGYKAQKTLGKSGGEPTKSISITVETMLNADGYSFLAAEQYAVTDTDTDTDSESVWIKKENYRVINPRRRGYGYFFGQMRLLTIILVGPTADSRIIFIQSYSRPVSGMKSIFLLRMGEDMVAYPESLLGDDDSLEMVNAYHLKASELLEKELSV